MSQLNIFFFIYSFKDQFKGIFICQLLQFLHIFPRYSSVYASNEGFIGVFWRIEVDLHS